MRRHAWILASVAVALWACSNDIHMPPAYHEDYLAQPRSVTTTIEGATLTVSWEMSSEANVAGYVVSFTDASGAALTRDIPGAATRSYAESDVDLSEGAVYLVEVWAFDEAQFFGPHSAADTVAVVGE